MTDQTAEYFLLDGKLMMLYVSGDRYAILKDNFSVFYIYEQFSWGYGELCEKLNSSSAVAHMRLNYWEEYL